MNLFAVGRDGQGANLCANSEIVHSREEVR